MAFNYRANNAKEIISKKKEFSLQAAEIYSYISKTYGEKIVLDPNKDFSDVKIPRAVEKKIGIDSLKICHFVILLGFIRMLNKFFN